jgi:hypothetical protein
LSSSAFIASACGEPFRSREIFRQVAANRQKHQDIIWENLNALPLHFPTQCGYFFF